MLATASARRVIRMDVRRRIWKTPCVICAVPYDIKCDPIKAWTNDNSYTRLVVMSRGLRHFQAAVHRHAVRYQGWDAPGLDRWLQSNADGCAEARALYAAFLSRFGA